MYLVWKCSVPTCEGCCRKLGWYGMCKPSVEELGSEGGAGSVATAELESLLNGWSRHLQRGMWYMQLTVH